MKHNVLILGGYGVFGQRIAAALAQEADMAVLIAGRNLREAKKIAATINAEALSLDIKKDLGSVLERQRPHLVINCCGPFQGQDYAIASACIQHGIHYIDLADARDYVRDFAVLNNAAARGNSIAITGASTLPAISSAVLDYFLATEFSFIHALDYGITPGNQTPRGVATVAAILSYVGKPFNTLIDGVMRPVFGWQSLHREHYPGSGGRWMSNCDVPDLDLFPTHYPSLRNIRFYAGLELTLLHVGLWLMSWLARVGLVRSFQPCATLFRNISLWFYALGTSDGGMHMKIEGVDRNGQPKQRVWYILARQGHGPHIPTIPAILLAKKILRQQITTAGAYAAVGLITRDEILRELTTYDIEEVIR